MKNSEVIVGVGTDVGKTIVAAIRTKLTNFTYWKPIQAGTQPQTDTERVIQLLEENVQVKTEKFKLNTPVSPHLAAEIDGVTIELSDLALNEAAFNHVIEGAGGIYVPINNIGDTYLDVLKTWELPVIVVSMHYLGSINHTLLTLNALKMNNISVKGVVFVGDENSSTESCIRWHFPSLIFHRINKAVDVNPEFIKNEVERWKLNQSWYI